MSIYSKHTVNSSMDPFQRAFLSGQEACNGFTQVLTCGMCYAEGAQIRTSGLSFIHPSTGAVFGTNRSLACKGGALGFLYALIGRGQHSLDTNLAASLSGVTAGCFTTLSLLSHHNQMSTPNKVSWLHLRITLLPLFSGAIVASCTAGATSMIYDSIFLGPQKTNSLKFW